MSTTALLGSLIGILLVGLVVTVLRGARSTPSRTAVAPRATGRRHHT